MKLLNEGIDDNPIFIRRRVGENRESINLTRLCSMLDKFLHEQKPLSSDELDDLSDMLHRGMLDIQKKRRNVLLKKIKKLKNYEEHQKKLADELGVPKKDRNKKD